MKKLIIIICLMFLLSVIAFASNGVEAKTVIKIAHESSEEHNIHKAFLFFAEKVAEKTKGEVEVKVFANGQLGDEQAIYEGVKLGTIDAGSGGLYPTVDPLFSLINLPFLFRDYNHVHKVLDGEIGKELKDIAWEKGYKVMCIWDGGFRQFTNNKRPIWEPKDLKGLVMRTPPITDIINAMKAFGSVVVSIPYGEVYTALSQGVADGEENSLTNITGMKFYEVQKYISIVNYMFNGDMFIMNPKVWNSFTPEVQKLLQEAVDEALAYQRNLLELEESKAIEIILGAGVKVNLVDPVPFYPLVEDIYKKQEEAISKDLVEKIRSIR